MLRFPCHMNEHEWMEPCRIYSLLVPLTLYRLNLMRFSLLFYIFIPFSRDRFPFYKSNDDRWKNSVRHNLSINPHFRKGNKAPQGAGHLWIISSRDSEANILAWEHVSVSQSLIYPTAIDWTIHFHAEKTASRTIFQNGKNIGARDGGKCKRFTSNHIICIRRNISGRGQPNFNAGQQSINIAHIKWRRNCNYSLHATCHNPNQFANHCLFIVADRTREWIWMPKHNSTQFGWRAQTKCRRNFEWRQTNGRSASDQSTEYIQFPGHIDIRWVVRCLGWLFVELLLIDTFPWISCATI